METIHLPEQREIDCEIAGNSVRQLRRAAFAGDATVYTLAIGKHQGYRIEAAGQSAAIIGKPLKSLPDGDVLLAGQKGKAVLPSEGAEPTTMRWLQPIPVTSCTAAELRERSEEVRVSWRGKFELRQEAETAEGLREPQVGAVHALLAHWTMSEDAATVVMPTGSGKTETMLSLIVSERLSNVLIVVPSAALRDQTIEKFASLGILPRLGIIGSGARYPVIGALEHGIESASAAESFMRACNVVIATMAAVHECPADARLALSNATEYLFMDEAHHTPAATWTAFRALFPSSRIVQFTATPFRNDGKRVDGRVVYEYPLGRAQAKGMFQEIRFTAVAAFTQEASDIEIAKQTKAQLDRDIADGLDHLAMARTRSISRAESVVELYRAIAPEYAPVLIHSNMGSKERREALRAIRARSSRIIVCVNMLGEGFDLPQLKIAAIHDSHKSLAITLQFIGRFARTNNDKVGIATAIANTVDPGVEESLEQLYAHDSDWNLILRNLSQRATRREIERSEFLKKFSPPLDVMPLQNVYPKMSTVAFDIGDANWNAERVIEALTAENRSTITINRDDQVALFIQRNDTKIRWGETHELIDTTWELFVIYWCDEHKLLFINSSDNSELHEMLAETVAEEELPIIAGNAVFRTLHGIQRLILNTVGLTHVLRDAIRFTMHSGSDVREGLTAGQTANSINTNLFGHGYEAGETASLGCSRKGRIWSHLVAYDIEDWLKWCRDIGKKLRDDTINDTSLPGNIIVPEPIDARPDAVPLTIEWPQELYEKPEEQVLLRAKGATEPLFSVGLRLDGHSETGPIAFIVTVGTNDLRYTLSFGDGMRCVPDAEDVEIHYGKQWFPLSAWLEKRSPVIRFHDNSFVAFGELFRVDSSHRPPFEPERIDTWDWTGIDLHKESQTIAKLPDSIQRRVIESVLARTPAFSIVFDDDDAGESADIVALRADDEFLHIEFYHCKYSQASTVGARLADLYEVCGQAQRSIQWRHDVERLLKHLRARDAQRIDRAGVSRFERGDQTELAILLKRARFLRTRFAIYLVQPGLSKERVTTGQLDLLSATDAYLKETGEVPLGVVASA
jgi:superfamily II DNA or RNA helicase